MPIRVKNSSRQICPNLIYWMRMAAVFFCCVEYECGLWSVELVCRWRGRKARHFVWEIEKKKLCVVNCGNQHTDHREPYGTRLEPRSSSSPGLRLSVELILSQSVDGLSTKILALLPTKRTQTFPCSVTIDFSRFRLSLPRTKLHKFKSRRQP